MAKRVADNFIMSDETAKAIGTGINTGGFGIRLFFYIFIGIIMSFILLLLMGMPKNPVFSNNVMINDIISLSVIFGVPFLIFYLKEKGIRKWRRENGFSIYKDIKEEIKQAEVDKRVAMEKKAYAKNGVNQGVDKNDIGYWFGLKESGAITEDEFLAKKRELLESTK